MPKQCTGVESRYNVESGCDSETVPHDICNGLVHLNYPVLGRSIQARALEKLPLQPPLQVDQSPAAVSLHASGFYHVM